MELNLTSDNDEQNRDDPMQDMHGNLGMSAVFGNVGDVSSPTYKLSRSMTRTSINMVSRADRVKKRVVVMFGALFLLFVMVVAGLIYTVFLGDGMADEAAVIDSEENEFAGEPNKLPDYMKGMQMRVSSDELFIMWANGDFIGVGGTVRQNAKTTVFEYDIGCQGSMIVAIEAHDTDRDGGGILGEFNWCGMRNFTNTKWRCTDQPGRSWGRLSGDIANHAKLLKDESQYPPAQDYSASLYERKGQRQFVATGKGQAQWIWTGERKKDTSVYCLVELCRPGSDCTQRVQVNGTDTMRRVIDESCAVEKGLQGAWGKFAYSLGGMLYAFAGLAMVCDEFFVPSLNVLCERLGISDDVAGATFMAAGASSPELFASMIGVLSGSAVGAGTVVGSELFNILVIVGAVSVIVKSGLQLDWRILAREVCFFAASLIAVVMVLSDGLVTMTEAICLICGYVVYVVVCKFYRPIMSKFCPTNTQRIDRQTLSEEFYVAYETDGGLPSLDEVSNPTAGNLSITGDPLSDSMTASDSAEEGMRARTLQTLPTTFNGAMFGMDYGDVDMHGFLFKKSEFYAKMRSGKNKWQRRWCVLDGINLYYVAKDGKKRVLVDSPEKWNHGYVAPTTPTEFEFRSDEVELVFKGQTPDISRSWLQKIQKTIDAHAEYSSGDVEGVAAGGGHVHGGGHADAEEEHEVHNMLAMPASPAEKVLHVVCFPMLVCFFLTIPDVRKPKFTKFFVVTMTVAILWLAALAEGMMFFAETVGCMLDIPDDIMGLTVTAAGTSLPNLFASVIVAKQGLGNMSVSNAFGSNTFNIFIALAVPWAVGAYLEGEKTGVYQFPVPKGKIFSSCLILGGVLVFFCCSLFSSRFKLSPPLGGVYITIYVVFIGYLISDSLSTE